MPAGVRDATKLTMLIDRELVRQRLSARRSELVARYRDLVVPGGSDASLLAVMTPADALALEQVIAELDRLDHSAGVTCQRCRVAIEPARLHGVPDALLCLDCAQSS